MCCSFSLSRSAGGCPGLLAGLAGLGRPKNASPSSSSSTAPPLRRPSHEQQQLHLLLLTQCSTCPSPTMTPPYARAHRSPPPRREGSPSCATTCCTAPRREARPRVRSSYRSRELLDRPRRHPALLLRRVPPLASSYRLQGCQTTAASAPLAPATRRPARRR
ncbi:hypothetical protein ACQJBY_028166 [Aegilops geniculata]